jgi:NTP pyrophosphatase (non-canonical NTP hydrolase)
VSYPVYTTEMGSQLVEEIDAELAKARKKFPSPEASMCALTEEVGELAKAMLDESRERVRKEAIQVIAMAVRIIQEGDPTLDGYRAKRGQKPLAKATHD